MEQQVPSSDLFAPVTELFAPLPELLYSVTGAIYSISTVLQACISAFDVASAPHRRYIAPFFFNVAFADRSPDPNRPDFAPERKKSDLCAAKFRFRDALIMSTSASSPKKVSKKVQKNVP
jgi:hypothetical protein